MPFKKGQSGNPKGKAKGCKNKPKGLVQKLQEACGSEISDARAQEMIRRALAHACGDTIVTESADGQNLTAKCVSDPRLFGMILNAVAKAEEKAPNFIAVPVSPEFYKSTMEKLKAIEIDVEPKT